MKVYKIQHINKVENPNTHYDFPVFYPNTEYFDGIQSVLNSYGIILDVLSKCHYDVPSFINTMTNNHMLNSFSKELDFEVRKKESNIVNGSERIVSENDDVVFELYYCGDVYQINDLSEETSYDVSLYIDFDYVQLYFTGSYIYIIDTKDNKKIFLYLD